VGGWGFTDESKMMCNCSIRIELVDRWTIAATGAMLAGF
jgi:hypothetical protein